MRSRFAETQGVPFRHELDGSPGLVDLTVLAKGVAPLAQHGAQLCVGDEHAAGTLVDRSDVLAHRCGVKSVPGAVRGLDPGV